MSQPGPMNFASLRHENRKRGSVFAGGSTITSSGSSTSTVPSPWRCASREESEVSSRARPDDVRELPRRSGEEMPIILGGEEVCAIGVRCKDGVLFDDRATDERRTLRARGAARWSSRSCSETPTRTMTLCPPPRRGVLARAPPAEVVVRLPDNRRAQLRSQRAAPRRSRVRVLPDGAGAPIDTPMVAPDAVLDAAFGKIDVSSAGTGIKVAGLGSVRRCLAGRRALAARRLSGAAITYSDPIGTNSSLCATQPATDVTSGTRAGDPATVADEAACCALCKQRSGCTNWIYGHPGDEEGNCWPMASTGPTTSSPTRTLGGKGGGTGVRLSTSAGALLYGSGSGKDDAAQLTAKSATPYVDNTVVYAPHYFSTDGYAVLAVVNTTASSGQDQPLSRQLCVRRRARLVVVPGGCAV